MYRRRSGRPDSRSRRPRRQGGAPLRRGHYVGTVAHWASRPRRQGGAPLRRRERVGFRRVGRVVPVVRAGLHCGTLISSLTTIALPRRPRRQGGAPLRPDKRGHGVAGDGSSPSSGRGSIAARPTCPAAAPATRRPRRQGGAPLRPQATERHALLTVLSSPSSGRGSIAATSHRIQPGQKAPSSPSSGRGSIAAGTSFYRCQCSWPVVPVVRAGLHCGR